MSTRGRPSPPPWDRWRSIIRRISLVSDDMDVARISEEDGSALYALLSMRAIQKGGEINVIDAGAGVGYSTLWLTMPLEDLCVKSTIIAIELDDERYNALARNIEQMPRRCVDVKAVHGDAIRYISELPGDFKVDFALIDIDPKELYLQAYYAIKPKLAKGAIVAFHNANNPWLSDVLGAIMSDAGELGWRSVIIPTRPGLMVIFT